MFKFFYFLISICGLIVLMSVVALAQVPLPGNQSEDSEEKEPEWPADSLGRRTPRGAVVGFIEAVAEEDYNRAARYLNLSEVSQSNPDVPGPELAQALQRLLDQQGNIIPRSLISDDPKGNLNENIPPNRDLVGTAEADGQSFDIVVEKTTGAAGGPIWLFSAETVLRIPVADQEINRFTIERLLPAFLRKNKWNGVSIGQWLAMFVLAVVAYLLAYVIIAVLVFLVRRLWQKAHHERIAEIIQAFMLPVRIYLAVWIFVIISRNIGISIIVRQSFSEVTVIVAVVALLLLAWRLVDIFIRFSEQRLAERGQLGRLSAVLFLRRSVKFVLIALGIIIILDTLGLDVTTGLAALGIGGIALALGAQKTVENLVGSLTLIADQPIRVGDFCKIGDTTGTVEQIGMRSTRIRTLSRTLVVIPNGELSSIKIENYAHRDRFWFHPILGLRYETTPDQLRYLLVELRAILYAHPKVSPDPARVRFLGPGADALPIEIFAYVLAIDYNEFLAIQEDLSLRIMELVAKSGTGFAFPSQTLYMAEDHGISEEKTREAEQKVGEWRRQGKLHIPSFDEDRIKELAGTLSYPSEGASVRVDHNQK